jgi:hypothetical protein
MLRRIFVVHGVFAAVFVLNNCAARQPPVWAFYDECSAQTSSFVAMAECGRQRRLAGCTAKNACSAVGTAFMQYTDALVLQVKRGEITEAEGLRRFAEYKSQVLSGVRRDEAIVAAGEAAGGPRSCTRIGNTVNCY